MSQKSGQKPVYFMHAVVKLVKANLKTLETFIKPTFF